jgi:hypothetical protein
LALLFISNLLCNYPPNAYSIKPPISNLPAKPFNNTSNLELLDVPKTNTESSPTSSQHSKDHATINRYIDKLLKETDLEIEPETEAGHTTLQPPLMPGCPNPKPFCWIRGNLHLSDINATTLIYLLSVALREGSAQLRHPSPIDTIHPRNLSDNALKGTGPTAAVGRSPVGYCLRQ